MWGIRRANRGSFTQLREQSRAPQEESLRPAPPTITCCDLILRRLGEKLHNRKLALRRYPAWSLAVSLPLTAPDVLNREFLELRAKILELAASFDRLDRASGEVGEDPRLAKLRKGVEILLSSAPERAERVQLLFSRSYAEDWRTALKVDDGRAPTKVPR